jgi:hypothetical protein
MKRVVFLLLCALTLLSQKSIKQTRASAAPQTMEHGGKIQARYDGFNNETVISLRKMRIICGRGNGLPTETCVNVAASLHAPGKQLDYVRHATLQLIFETKDWDRRHSPEQRNLAVVANGETIRLGKMALVRQNVENDQLIDVMKEVLQVSLPYKVFDKIARADFVELKVGNSEFALQPKNLAALRDLNNRVKP